MSSLGLSEGYTLDDFKKVVDLKFDEWKATDMSKYIRPETLFGNKFDGYLNQLPVNNSKGNYISDGVNAVLEKRQPWNQLQMQWIK